MILPPPCKHSRVINVTAPRGATEATHADGRRCSAMTDGYTCSLLSHHVTAHRAYIGHNIRGRLVRSWANRPADDNRCSSMNGDRICGRPLGHPHSHVAFLNDDPATDQWLAMW